MCRRKTGRRSAGQALDRHVVRVDAPNRRVGAGGSINEWPCTSFTDDPRQQTASVRVGRSPAQRPALTAQLVLRHGCKRRNHQTQCPAGDAGCAAIPVIVLNDVGHVPLARALALGHPHARSLPWR
jgi:hypothetical protein